MQFKLTTSILAILLAATKTYAQFESIAEFCDNAIPYDYDSGDVSSGVVVAEVSAPDDSPSIQLDLSEITLGTHAVLKLIGASSSQEFDAAALENNDYSAVFDGTTVRVELVAKATGGGLFRGRKLIGNTSRVKISAIKVPTCKPSDIAPSICGATDDRIPSSDPRQGRIGGCTGWLISENVFCQAGHCGTPSSSTRMHFTYGVSNAPVEDQYAVDVSTYRGVNGGVGNDWGCGRLLPNSSTGLLPGVAQGGWYTIGNVPSTPSGNVIRITGYGTADVDSRSQKTHTGNLDAVNTSSLRYVPDTTGGNSGSPVIHENNGLVIGVHTHGGCSATGGANSGTRADLPAFASHREFLLRVCTQDSDCDDNDGSNGVETCDVNNQCQFGTPPTPSPTPSPACADANDKRIQISVLTDNYPSETSWELVDTCGGVDTLVQSKPLGSFTTTGTQYSDSYCIPEAAQYRFTINDTFGDGICCGYGIGEYEVVWDRNVIATGGAFGSSASVSFGGSCPAPTPTPPPTTANPTTANPTPAPTTANPTANPTTAAPTTAQPTNAPSTANPTTAQPTNAPTTAGPTAQPTPAPTPQPTIACGGLRDPAPGGCPNSQTNAGCCSGQCWKNGSWAGLCK